MYCAQNDAAVSITFSHYRPHYDLAVATRQHLKGSRNMKIRRWIPNIITVLLAALLVVTQQAWASPLMARLASPTATSKTSIAYQGYLTDSAGAAVNETLEMVFKLYSVESGGAPLWSEIQPSVVVADPRWRVTPLWLAPVDCTSGRNWISAVVAGAFDCAWFGDCLVFR